MSTLLVIQAYSNDKSVHLDRLNQHFITSYQQAHPKDRIIFHDLIKDSTPTLNSQMLMALRKKQHQKPLSAFEQKLLCKHDDWLNDFMLADKYLFVAPIQQRFLPAELKQYLDLIVATLTEMAPHKKALHLQATDRTYHPKSLKYFWDTYKHKHNLGNKYLQKLLSFYGLKDFTTLHIEGLANCCTSCDLSLKHCQKQLTKIANAF